MTQVHSGSNELPLLSPGWELVDTLPEHQEDDADEWEEDEVSYLVLDSGSKLRSAELLALNEIQISELESERPIIRLGPHIFEARYENLLGSELILSEETTPEGELSLKPMALTSTHLRMNPLILSQPDFKEIDNNAAVHVPGMPRKRGRPRGAKSRNSSNRGAARGTGRGRGRGRGRGGSSIAAEASFQNVDEDVDMEGNDRPHPYNPIPAVSEQVEDLGELPTSAAIHLPPALSSTYKPMV